MKNVHVDTEPSVLIGRISYFHSLQDVKSPDKLPSMRVSLAVMRDLSKELPKWEFPARALGLDEAEIERIRANHPLDNREQCYQMLLNWEQSSAQKATYQALGHALQTEAPKVYPKYVEIISAIVH